MKRLLREHAPAVHLLAIRTRERAERLRRAPARGRARRVLASADSLQVVISHRAGLGGLLVHVSDALRLPLDGGRVTVRLTSPLYAPPGLNGDWLSCYFQRHDAPDDAAPCVELVDLVDPRTPQLPVGEAATLVWRYMSIDDALVAESRQWSGGRYAAVHFRGSDKHYEAPRVTYDAVLDRVADQMSAHQLSRLFAASDETAFLDVARERFDDVFVLPQQAVADGMLPPHFSDVPGDVKAREALLTMLVLAGSEVMVRTESYLSAWAHTLNPEQTEVVVRLDEGQVT